MGVVPIGGGPLGRRAAPLELAARCAAPCGCGALLRQWLCGACAAEPTPGAAPGARGGTPRYSSGGCAHRIERGRRLSSADPAAMGHYR
jgi:hypothetical protein